jgi:stearoyl-CoA desaturase (delta-9 desaturase)
MNVTTALLDLMAKIGWAYDLKTVSVDMINKRVQRTGDGSRDVDAPSEDDGDGHHHHHENSIWGWGDKDMKADDMELVEIHHQKLPKFVQ